MTEAASPPRPPLRVVSPATGELVAEVPDGTDDVPAAVARARAAQPGWAALPLAERARVLRRVAAHLRDDGELVRTLVAESGKPEYEAIAFEILYTLELTRFYTGRSGRRALRDELRGSLVFPWKRARVVKHPRGVAAVIGPWNWPLLNNYADAVAPLLSGNSVVLKPSEWTPLTSLRVAEVARGAGLPAGVLEVVPGGAGAGRALVGLADLVFFTGSVHTGRAIAAAAAERMIPAILELGGKSAMIVLADADLERAAAAAVWSAFAHSGQVCVRTERILVEAAVAEAFTALCVEAVRRLRHGPAPGSAAHDVGAMTFPPQMDVCAQHIADAVAGGARVVAGGGRLPGRPGSWFEPTVLAGCTPRMRVMREETFGPVLPVAVVRDAEEAIAIANASHLGLAGSVWSRDAARAAAVARRIESGSVCVNDVLLHYLCVAAPLGGVKGSGLGFRHGAEALRQFCRIETVLEDRPGLGWLAALASRQLMFPYRARTLRALQALMRWLY